MVDAGKASVLSLRINEAVADETPASAATSFSRVFLAGLMATASRLPAGFEPD
jgi:hypothetical protein